MSNFFHRLKCFKIKYNHEAMYLKKKYPTVYIEQDAIISAVESLTLGEHVNISRGLRLFCQGGVHIGSYTQIAINFTCYSDEHLYDQNDFIPVSNKKKLKPTHIGDFCLIGANVSIAPGVTIGEGSIIGIGSVVVSSIPPLSIVMGNPGRIIKMRNEEEFYSLKKQKLYYYYSVNQGRWVSEKRS